jgi:hypothetical protein
VVVEPPRVGVAVSVDSATLSWREAEEPGGGGMLIVAEASLFSSGEDCSDSEGS